MTEADIEIIVQGAKEKYSEARPRIISDNGPLFIAKDFKEFIRISGMTHVRTSAFYPQSNGKIERWHKSLKGECIRPGTPLSVEDARRLVIGYVNHYNNVRLNSATRYITPKDMLAGRQQEIHAERDRKLEEARKATADSSPASRMTQDTGKLHALDPQDAGALYAERCYKFCSGGNDAVQKHGAEPERYNFPIAEGARMRPVRALMFFLFLGTAVLARMSFPQSPARRRDH